MLLLSNQREGGRSEKFVETFPPKSLMQKRFFRPPLEFFKILSIDYLYSSASFPKFSDLHKILGGAIGGMGVKTC